MRACFKFHLPFDSFRPWANTSIILPNHDRLSELRLTSANYVGVFVGSFTFKCGSDKKPRDVIEPSEPMSFDEYQQELEGTQGGWNIVDIEGE